MTRADGFLCRCWEIAVEPDAAESFLAGLRKKHPGVLLQIFGGKRPRTGAVEMIAAQTLTAAKSGNMLADKPELDLLMRIAGTRQIGEAFRLLGYKSGGKELFIVAASSGEAKDMGRLAFELSRDGRFVGIERKPLTKDDLDSVERAALLAVRL